MSKQSEPKTVTLLHLNADNLLEEAVNLAWRLDPCAQVPPPEKPVWSFIAMMMVSLTLKPAMKNSAQAEGSFWYTAAEVILARIDFQKNFNMTPRGIQARVKNLIIKRRIGRLVRKIVANQAKATEDSKPFFTALLLELETTTLRNKENLKRLKTQVHDDLDRMREREERDYFDEGHLTRPLSIDYAMDPKTIEPPDMSSSPED